MKRIFSHSVWLSLCLAGATFSVSAAPDPAPDAKAGTTRHDSMLVTLTASVEAINYETREVTLKGPLGNSVTFTADKRVKRLNEIKQGDLVQADYYLSIAAELRKPTAEEAEHPLEVMEAGGKAPLTHAPAAGVARRFKVVTTVEGLDRSQQTVTVKGPRGRTLTARVEDPARLTEMRLGDTIVITYTEALAVSLDKVEKKSQN